MTLSKAACVILLLTIATARADFYVAPLGSDRNDGTELNPFLTLERARDAVRELKRAGKVPAPGITVWLRAGDYIRTNSLELTAADSGTAEAPITWRGYGDERARLLGGRLLSGFKKVTGVDVLARLKEEARHHIVQLDLREVGVSDFGEMKSRGFGRAVTPAHCELFSAGRPMTLARWPNEGAWEKIAGFPEASGKGDDHGGKIGELQNGFFYRGDRPRHWKDTGDLWVHGYWAWDWANSYERVVELDHERDFIRTAPPHGLYGFRTGQRFYFLNLLEELDQPGEWFLDWKSGVLYFWPPEEAKASQSGKTETILSLSSEPLLRMTDASHLRVRGLILEATRGNAVEIRGGAGNLVVGCVIRNIGNNGVIIEGGQGHGVRSCDIFDTGDGGVSLSGGDRQTLTAGGHFAENCHFQRQGRWSKCYVPAVLLNGVGSALRIISFTIIHTREFFLTVTTT